MKKNIMETLSSFAAFVLNCMFAGVMISVGCVAYLKIGGVAGACMFSIGLLGVVTYGLNLFTGKAGFASFDKNGTLRLAWILIFNFCGAALAAQAAAYAWPELAGKCAGIIAAKSSSGVGKAFVAAVGCGILMSLAISGTRSGSYVPLLFAVPCFILSGYFHCVADAFYWSAADFGAGYIPVYAATVAGNFCGCVVHRFCTAKTGSAS